MSRESGEQLATKRLYTGRRINVDLDSVRAPDGTELELELVRHPGAAAIVALLSEPDAPDPQVLLIRQYRWAAGGDIWEIPAGVLEPGEEAEACARRELKEETGAEARYFEHLTTIFTTPGFTDERIHLFLATGITVGETAHEPDELITIQAHPISRALAMIRDGEITDGKTIAGLLFAAGFRLNL